MHTVYTRIEDTGIRFLCDLKIWLSQSVAAAAILIRLCENIYIFIKDARENFQVLKGPSFKAMFSLKIARTSVT